MTGRVGPECGFSWMRNSPDMWKGPRASLWSRLGFGFHREKSSEPSIERVKHLNANGTGIIWDDWIVAIPYWLIVALLTFLPFPWMLKIRRRARQPRAIEGTSPKPES